MELNFHPTKNGYLATLFPETGAERSQNYKKLLSLGYQEITRHEGDIHFKKDNYRVVLSEV